MLADRWVRGCHQEWAATSHAVTMLQMVVEPESALGLVRVPWRMQQWRGLCAVGGMDEPASGLPHL